MRTKQLTHTETQDMPSHVGWYVYCSSCSGRSGVGKGGCSV